MSKKSKKYIATLDPWQKDLEEKQVWRFAWRLSFCGEEKMNCTEAEFANAYQFMIDELCKKEFDDEWRFQLERGAEGTLHYQGYGKRTDKGLGRIRAKTLAKRLNDRFLGIWITPAADEMNLKNYCIKPETRVAGPWSSKPIIENSFSTAPIDYITVERLRPWQKELYDILTSDPSNWRDTIIWIADTHGLSGKSAIAKLLKRTKGFPKYSWSGAAHNALYAVANEGPKNCYQFDLTRSHSKKQDDEIGMYEAIENIKGGSFLSSKYKPIEVDMAEPHIVCYSNQMPNVKCITLDRWRIYSINPDLQTMVQISARSLLPKPPPGSLGV